MDLTEFVHTVMHLPHELALKRASVDIIVTHCNTLNHMPYKLLGPEMIDPWATARGIDPQELRAHLTQPWVLDKMSAIIEEDMELITLHRKQHPLEA